MAALKEGEVEAPPITQPKIIAHRGAGYHRPGNTLEAFEWAVEADIDGVELDIHLAADNVLVTHHNKTVGFLPFLRNVEHVNSTDLKEQWHVPTLREVLQLCLRKGSRLTVIVVEMKNKNVIGPLVELLREFVSNYGSYRICNTIRVSSFDWTAIDQFNALHTFVGFHTAYLSDYFNEELLTRATIMGVTDIHLHDMSATPAIVAHCHQAHIQIMLWPSGVDGESLKHVLTNLEMGADLVCMNDPKRRVY